jgi:hypothetical protein
MGDALPIASSWTKSPGTPSMSCARHRLAKTPSFLGVTARLRFAVNRASHVHHPEGNKKKPQYTPKEKKKIKQQRKHASDTVPFIKH